MLLSQISPRLSLKKITLNCQLFSIMHILSHRGINLSQKEYFTESSCKAFTDQVTRGFGLEFDLQFTKDKKIAVLHDHNLARLTEGKDIRKIKEIESSELWAMDFKGYRIISFGELLRTIQANKVNQSINAIHIKHAWQKKEYIELILAELKHADLERFIFFDLKIDTARYIKMKNPTLKLAPSVAHPYDILRYNALAGNTLFSVKEAIKHRNIFDWAWLDEWNLSDANNKIKKLYTREIFLKFREAGFKIALVSPELHAWLPNNLAEETHPDAKTKDRLNKRLCEIVDLAPDAICTDHPSLVKKIASS